MFSQPMLGTNFSQDSHSGRKRNLVKWTEEDFIKFTKPQVPGSDFLIPPANDSSDSEESSEEGGFENVGQAIRAFSFMVRQSAMARMSAIGGAIMGRISMKAPVEPEKHSVIRPTTATTNTIGRSTVILGPNDYVNPNMGSDIEALHTAISVMQKKFDQVPGSYKLWEKWFRPVCDPVLRMRGVNRRFEIKYQIKVLDYRRDDQNTARHLQRTIRQLFKSECATLNNRSKNEELGETLMQKLKGDMSFRRKALEAAEAQKMTRWIQAGILTNDWASVTAEPTPRKDRRPRRSFHSGGSSRQVDPLSTFFTTDANELIPPSLSPLREKIKGREVGNESLVDAFPISLTAPGSISKATEQSAVSDFDSLVEASVVIEKPEKSPPWKMFRIPFDKRFLVDTTSLEETTIQATSDDPDETEVPTDSSLMQDRHWTREKNPPEIDALYHRAEEILHAARGY